MNLGQGGAWHRGRGASTALGKIQCGFPDSVFSFLKRGGHDRAGAERVLWNQAVTMKKGRYNIKSGSRTERTRKKSFLLERVLWIFFALWLPVLASVLIPVRPAGAAEDPEDLYRKGRFAEAEKAYAALDMDHPKDVRYRYNRGCAAYRNSDYQGARAAFSSVLKRSGDNEVRLKAAYNLGNAAFKQGDYQSAADYFRQALLSNPAHDGAKYNLELALRALEKQKKEQEKSPQREGESGEKEASQGSEKGKKAGDEDPEKPASKKPDAQEEHRGRKKGDSEGEEGKPPQEQQEGRADGRDGAEQKSPEDLSGELRPLRDSADQGDGGEDNQEAGSLAGIDRKKAEALLDNIKEDRSRYLRFLVPEGKKRGGGSGKDW